MNDKLRTGKIRVLRQSDITRCPHVIFDAEHYRPDGTCLCNDPNATVMAEWGYEWDPNEKMWKSPIEP